LGSNPDLAYSYDGVFTRDDVAQAVSTAWELLAPVSTVKMSMSEVGCASVRSRMH
jgi:hypothetical protein